MDKLEQILRAEEAARHTVADAREQARVRTTAAEAEARALIAEQRTTAEAGGAAHREAVLLAAEELVRTIKSETDAARAANVARARARMDEVVATAVRELVG
jgi:vacuolar-type H+-ATPase subunit H